MNPTKLVRLSAASAVLLVSYGCHRPTPAEIAEEAAENTAALIAEAGQAAQAANEMTTLDTVSAGVRTASGSACAATDPACAAPNVPAQDSFDAQVAQIRKFLKERIFIEENLESSDSFSATFRVPGSAICSDGTTAADPACVSQVDAAELRVKAWPQMGGGVNLQVLVSRDRFELMALELGKKTLAATTDLPQTKKALDFVAAISSSTTTPTPRVLEGKLEVRLTKNAEQDFTFSYGVLWGVKVEWADPQGREYSFSTASSNPVASLRMEAPQRRATLEANVGETRFSGPWLDPATGTSSGKVQTYFLSGLSGKVVAEEGKDVKITNVGLGGGQSYIQVDGDKVTTVDLNKDSWRHLDVTLQRDSADRVVLVVSPEFDAIMGYFYSALRQLGVQYPDTLQDESLRVRLNGSSAPALTRIAPDLTTGFPGGWKILSGQLTISTDQAGYDPLVVAEGRCLIQRQTTPPAGGHPIYGMWDSMDCQ
ncbi:MAG TPA: hypothetical protein VFB81_23600 [Myxococcales bacterium]|nr:hypothetical protein [Myxococcales bacterium]